MNYNHHGLMLIYIFFVMSMIDFLLFNTSFISINLRVRLIFNDVNNDNYG